MIKVNSVSGGRTSCYLAMKYPADHNVFSVVCLDDRASAPKDPALRRYASHKLAGFVGEFGEFIATAEDDRTLQVMMDLEQLLGKEITWVRGMSFDTLINSGDFKGLKSRLPSWARRYCTHTMKILPMVLWWFHNISEKCEMRIGFRFDEFKRMERFFNNGHATSFRLPISCKTYGQRRMEHVTFDWRYCAFPLVQDGITKEVVEDYWKNHGWMGGTLLEPHRQIEFPAISNCVGCFHKKPETLAAMADLHPDKFRWFIDQEGKGKGRWLDEALTYQHIMDHKLEIGKEVIAEARVNTATCDTGGCTD
jgi:hypothetical protein